MILSINDLKGITTALCGLTWARFDGRMTYITERGSKVAFTVQWAEDIKAHVITGISQ